MNTYSRSEQENTPFYKRTVSVVGYEVPYWLIMLLILAIAMYFAYTRNVGGIQTFKLNMGQSELAPASSVETPTVIRNAAA
jgi:hypothetical protein